MRSKEICFIKVIVIQRKEDNMNVKYLYQMFPTKEKRNHFLSQCVLTYGLSLDSLCNTLNLNKEKTFDEFSS